MGRTLVALACLACFGQAHASWMAGCNESAEVKTANVRLWLTKNIDDAVPNIPPETERYFAQEYGPAINSNVPGRYESLKRQPLFMAWQIRKSMNTILSNLELLTKKQSEYYVIFPYPSYGQTRIYWAVGAMSVLPSLQRDIDAYGVQQRSSRQPLASETALIQLESALPGIAMTLNQLVECELDQVKAPGPVLKVSEH